MDPVKKELTKEIYVRLNNEGKSDKEVMGMYDMNHNVFYKLKGNWGLTKNAGGRPKNDVIREKDIVSNDQSKASQELKEEIDKYKQTSTPQQEQPQKEPQECEDKKAFSIDVFNNITQKELEASKAKIKSLEQINEKFEKTLIESDQKILALRELIEILERQCQQVEVLEHDLKEVLAENASLKVAVQQKVEYSPPENRMITEDWYQELLKENEALKQSMVNYQNQYLNLADKINRLTKENEYLTERNEQLQQYEEKYYATSKTLKLHL